MSKFLLHCDLGYLQTTEKNDWRRIRDHYEQLSDDVAIRRCRQEWVDSGRFQRHDGSSRPGPHQIREDRLIVILTATASDSSLSTIRRAAHTETRGRSSSTSQLHPRGAGVGNLVVVFSAGLCALCREEQTPGSGAPTFLPSHWSASLILLGKWFEGRDE
ncbi:hypothetical protein TNCV_4806161 [Trichonephila clavipes]|nr:hypothetical protein TNCV_4806161 [Trichonephila clavipes]